MTSAEGLKRRLVWLAAFVASVIVIAIPLGYDAGSAYLRVDSEWYLYIAQGNSQASMFPFASRQLGPLIVRALSLITHASILHCFLWLGIASLLTLAIICGWLLIQRGAGWMELLAVGVIFFWIPTFGGFMLPDTFVAALLAIFLFLLWKDKYAWAAAMLLPMFLARESTLLILICLLVLGWNVLSLFEKCLSAVASVTGIFLVRFLAANSLPNREHLNPFVYMVAKMPWNFVSNVLSIAPWTSKLEGFCVTPMWMFYLPYGIHLAGADAIGVCAWYPIWDAHLILLALCSFGLLPLFTLYLARYHSRLLWGQTLFQRFCVMYGGITFLIAPLLGRSMERLFLYSWPLFLLITPVLIAKAFRNTALPWKILLLLHLVTAWLDYLIFNHREEASAGRAWGLCAIVVAVNLLSWQILRRADVRQLHRCKNLEGCEKLAA